MILKNFSMQLTGTMLYLFYAFSFFLMEISVLIARIVAVTYLASGVALLNGNLDLMKTYKELKSVHMFSTIMGAFTLLLGMLIVNLHNVWVQDWQVLITLIGWILLIEGVLYLTAPQVLFGIFEKLPKSQKGWGIFTIILGLIFAYFGFMA